MFVRQDFPNVVEEAHTDNVADFFLKNLHENKDFWSQRAGVHTGLQPQMLFIAGARSENCRKFFPANRCHHNWEPYSSKCYIERYNRPYWSVGIYYKPRISKYSLICDAAVTLFCEIQKILTVSE